ncbi:hypothetical protein ACFXDJ_35420 [Streptomyces sp. NPDC059443]|uniref:hypothetical protein n=1 Tax=unclassified Streptomyces TaxID=2593676 RepID=UPI0036CCDBF5
MRIPAGLAGLALALAVGVLWWWAVLRLALTPAEAGPLEGAVAVGGWGLGLLPVHCVPGPGRVRRGAGGVGSGAGDPAGGDSVAGDSVAGDSVGEAVTRASTPRRSDEGSGPS